ncbi:MAG TPA: hypothetical protein VGP72_31595 [Planctomycetota bacterium]|jgi:hypothetical protein
MTKKTRAGFQIHLSTVYVLVILASVLLWGNVIEYTGTVRVNAVQYGKFYTSEATVRGWPMYYSVQHARHADVTPWKMFGNLVIGVMFISAVGYGCEWYIVARMKKDLNRKDAKTQRDSEGQN